MKAQAKRFVKDVRAAQPINEWMVAVGRNAVRLTKPLPDILAKYVPPSGLIEAELPNGQRLKLWSEASADGDDQIARYIYWKGWLGIQPEMTKLYWRLAKGAEVILDIGAHVGLYALLGAYANPHASIYAFEPLPIAIDRLQRNIELNDLAARIVALPLAISNHSGTTDFYHIARGFPSSSSLDIQFMRAGSDAMQIVSTAVDTTSIDVFFRGNESRRIGLVKIDTETTEPDVIEGMMELVHEARPHIICEVLQGYDVERRLESLLKPMDYHYFAITSSGLVKSDKIIATREFRDYLFAPAESSAYGDSVTPKA